MTFKPSVDKPVDSQSPLREFRGVLVKYDAVERSYEADEKRELAARTSQSVKFRFDELEVIETTEPWPLPQAEITVPYPSGENRGQNRWTALTESMAKFFPERDIELWVGKRMRWKYGPAKLRLPVRDEEGNNTGKWAVQDGEAWQCEEVEGLGSANDGDFKDRLLELLDGKKDTVFYEVVFATPSLKSHPDYMGVVDKISKRELLTEFAQAGLATQDAEGVWHRA